MLSGTNLSIRDDEENTNKKHLLINFDISRGRLNLIKQDTQLSGPNVTFSLYKSLIRRLRKPYSTVVRTMDGNVFSPSGVAEKPTFAIPHLLLHRNARPLFKTLLLSSYGRVIVFRRK